MPPFYINFLFQDFITNIGKQSASTNLDSSSQLGNVSKIVIDCECEFNICDLDNAWAEEFSQFRQSNVDGANSKTYNQDFWKKLEDEWKEISNTNADHPWLSDFNDFEPFKAKMTVG